MYETSSTLGWNMGKSRAMESRTAINEAEEEEM